MESTIQTHAFLQSGRDLIVRQIIACMYVVHPQASASIDIGSTG